MRRTAIKQTLRKPFNPGIKSYQWRVISFRKTGVLSRSKTQITTCTYEGRSPLDSTAPLLVQAEQFHQRAGGLPG